MIRVRVPATSANIGPGFDSLGIALELYNYITVDNKKINVHIAMSQNEEHYRTILYLASPILPDTW